MIPQKIQLKIIYVLRSGLFNDSWRYRLWRWISKLQKEKIFWIPLNIKGKKIWICGIHGKTDAVINLQKIENEPFQVALSLLDKKKKSLILDVGANLGQSLLVAKSHSDNRVVCYEPSPSCVKILQHTVHKNSFRGVIIRSMGLGSRAGSLQLFGSGACDSNASLVPGFRSEATQSTTVQVSTLDREIQKNPRWKPSLIKIDVEGGEYDVLQGATKVLTKHRPIICIETLYPKTLCHKKRQSAATRLLKRARYQFFHFREGGSLKVSTELRGDPSYQYNDYLCFPKEKTEKFMACLKLIKHD